jgi:CHAD domain-containing protein
MIRRSSFLAGYSRAQKDIENALESYLRLQGEEQVHGLRTAIRRFERCSALLPATLRKEKRMRRYRSTLKKLLKMNNRIRDLDSIGGGIASALKGPDLEWLRTLLKTERTSLEGPARQLASSIEGGVPEVDMEKLGPRKLHRRFRKLASSLIEEVQDDLDAVLKDPADTQALHSLRIGAKELRYTVELLPRGEQAEVVGGLRDWQDALGRIRDIDVMTDYLGGLELSRELSQFVNDKRDERRRLYLRFVDSQKRSRLIKRVRRSVAG